MSKLTSLIDRREDWQELQHLNHNCGVRVIVPPHPAHREFLDHPDRAAVDDAVRKAPHQLKPKDWSEVVAAYDYLTTLRGELGPLTVTIHEWRRAAGDGHRAAKPLFANGDPHALLGKAKEIASLEAAIELATRSFLEPLKAEILHLETEIVEFIRQHGGTNLEGAGIASHRPAVSAAGSARLSPSTPKKGSK